MLAQLFVRPVMLLVAVAMALLTGCSAIPFKSSQINAAQIENRSPAAQPVFSDMDHALACLGDRLREQKIQPLTLGYVVADTTGKTGVDLSALMRSSLSKVAARGNNIAVTNMGFGPSAKPEVPSAEERYLQRDPARAAKLVHPDWLITGGSVSLANAFLSIQKSGGLSARDLDLAVSATSTVDLLTLSFGVKYAESGLDLPMPTVDIRVSYQLLSAANEAGVFAQAQVNGRPLAAGLRLGRTVAISQVPEDAIRVGVDMAVARILSSRFGVDMAQCPSQALTPDRLIPKAERLPSVNALPKFWQSMSPAERVQWFQRVLAALGYAPGEVDGKLGPRTREALTLVAQDIGLPPSGQGSDALFYALATRELALGRDPRKPPPPAEPAAPRRIQIQLQQPNAPYVAGTYLRATVVAPQAGYMNCWLVTPEGPLSLLPILSERGNFVTAGSPVLLPDNNPSGPHPRVRLTMPGAHELWCGEARTNVTDRLPAELRPGGLGMGFAGTSALREAFAKAAGSQWLADGSALFNVIEAVR